jgi:hypothetical protein
LKTVFTTLHQLGLRKKYAFFISNAIIYTVSHINMNEYTHTHKTYIYFSFNLNIVLTLLTYFMIQNYSKSYQTSLHSHTYILFTSLNIHHNEKCFKQKSFILTKFMFCIMSNFILNYIPQFGVHVE